jgi:very-short-patch-repair endonuclease
MRKTLEDYPNLVKEFDFKKNSSLTPKDLSFGSGKRIWWLCPKKHGWESTVANRKNGNNCPYCSGYKTSKENSLKFLFPNIAKEWHPTKNGKLRAEDVTKSSGKKVWWLCSKKHEYNSQISTRSRLNGSGCPYCAGHKVSKDNNLKFLFPNIAKEWHPTKNGKLKPEDFTKGSSKKIWWLCSQGHEFKVIIGSRSKGTGCPYCSGNLVSKENNLKFLFPNIAKEWHPTKNGKLRPEDFTKSSSKKVWWLCSQEHEWLSIIASRKNGNNCPYCSGHKVSKDNNLKFLFPNIAKEWHPTKNEKLRPEDFTKGSKEKVWWLCSKGHEYKTRIAHRTLSRSNCPKCSKQSSKPEFRILSELETIFQSIDSRHKFGKTEVDIFIKEINVAVEYDGSYYHKDKKTNDEKKNIFLKKYSIKLIRVRHEPLKKLDNLDVIVKKDELTKDDLNNILKSIYNFCNNEQKILIKKYLIHKSFINEKSYNKYLSYFPAPIPKKSLASIKYKFTNEWHYIKNFPLTPQSFYPSSNIKVWWRCIKGHEWEARISNRTLGKDCPYCSGHRVGKENNLKFLFPNIAKEWHPTKNSNLKAKDVTKSSGKKVWWLCPKKHEYITTVGHRTSGKNCPYCSGHKTSKENNLKFLFPNIAKEWHPTKNGKLRAEDVTKRSGKKVWWLCSQGHEWLSIIASRTNRKKPSGCPYCFNKRRGYNRNHNFTQLRK